MLDVSQAKTLISEVKADAIAHGRLEETWYKDHNHVFGAAELAKAIADRISGMDSSRIYVMTLLHDIGKIREDREGRFHGIIGYEILKDIDIDAARAALLHMFPWNKLPVFDDCRKMFFDKEADYNFVKNYAETYPCNDYDLLVQTADSFADSRGLVTLEQRAEDYAKRHGIDIDRKAFEPRENLKKYFDEKINGNIYDLFSVLNQRKSGFYMVSAGRD